MFRTVELPLWVLVLVLLFAAVTALTHVIGPSVRWFFRRRMERVVARLNERLETPIQPFKLARRHDMIQRLSYDASVIEAVNATAAEEGIPEQVAFERAQRYAREIVPSFSASAYFGFATRAGKWLSRALYRVRLGYVDDAKLAAASKDATLVFVMNHRSNMDYVLVTYLAADRSALSYAVGEWARVWPLQSLIKSMGAYFIRRKSRNPLYRRVLARYVQMATEGGVAQAMFPEGGLSLDGSVGEAKLGLISYILAGFTPGTSRDVVFVPVGLNYDRVLEDRVLVAAHATGTRRFPFRFGRFLRFAGRQIWLRLTSKFYRFGYASVSFGDPLSLTEFLGGEQADDARTEALGTALMGRIRDVVPVLPVPLLASVVLEGGHRTETALREAAKERLDALMAVGAHVHLPRDDVDYAIEVGIRTLVLRQMVLIEAGELTVPEDQETILRYYARSIDHHTAMLAQ